MILDPACGPGGMFVHSAEFVRRHHKVPSREIRIYGVEKIRDTLRPCRMILAVNGLSGDVRKANSYYDDPHKLIGRFDFVMANPPFNQPEVDRAKLVNETGKVDPRFPLGLPTVNYAKYIWINLLYAALKPTGRAGFVMAHSASDAGGSEREIKRKTHRDRRTGLHHRGRCQHVLHGHAAGHAVFPRQGQGDGVARRQGSVHKRGAVIPTGHAGASCI